MYDGTLVVAGETMCTRPFLNRTEPEFLDLLKILQSADTTYAHLEMNFMKPGVGRPGRAIAVSALRADPQIAQELKQAGVDMVSCAYNHVLDWGMASLEGTMEAVDAAGLTRSGIGHSLEEARAPGYFESRAGRVAIISIGSGQHPNDSAGATKAPVAGRPGVNPLRIAQKFQVTADDIAAMNSIWKGLGIPIKPRFNMRLEDGEVCYSLGDHGGGASTSFIFKEGPQYDVITIPDENDVEGNIRAVNDARRQADLVIVAHHAAINDGIRGEKPARVVPPFAKACLDAGADIFIGHGWHRQLGVELYNGKPIFYGTGNFFAQSQYLTEFPADVYEGFGFTGANLQNAVTADLHDAREANMAHWKAQPWGVLSSLRYEQGKMKEIILHPYSLGYDFSGKPVRTTADRVEGRPTLVYGDEAHKIIGEFARLSAQYGTTVQVRDDVGVITL